MNLHELARLGISVRIKELQKEIERLRKIAHPKRKKLHWTQTPEGRAILSKAMKKTWEKKKK